MLGRAFWTLFLCQIQHIHCYIMRRWYRGAVDQLLGWTFGLPCALTEQIPISREWFGHLNSFSVWRLSPRSHSSVKKTCSSLNFCLRFISIEHLITLHLCKNTARITTIRLGASNKLIDPIDLTRYLAFKENREERPSKFPSP